MKARIYGETSSASMGTQVYSGKIASRKANPSPNMVADCVARARSPGLASTPPSSQPASRMNGIASVW